ncbi:MAG TPA: FkbM family methyltransferase [Geminicoccaceae bacterium]|nr:FkbM family methyltransferase [Geminicoccus sp.]HMU51448.1 FkbM family methyltransferase [Geminicoccaceae bacterium]
MTSFNSQSDAEIRETATADSTTVFAYQLKQCRHGLFLINPQDIYIGRSLSVYGEYSEYEIQALISLVQPGAWIVEAGANIGADTVPLARHIGPKGRLLAFEPQRIVHQLLCANLALNGVFNVAARWMACGSGPGELVVPPLDYTKEDNFGGIQLAESGPGERVSVAAVDSFDLQRCDLIKADVEGMEFAVLQGSIATIRRHWPRLYIENNGRGDSPALIDFLMQLGYRLYWHLPPLFNPNNFASNPDNIFGKIQSSNMVCVGPQDKPVWGLRQVTGPNDVGLQRHAEKR